jgi:hypothetical protein
LRREKRLSEKEFCDEKQSTNANCGAKPQDLFLPGPYDP